MVSTLSQNRLQELNCVLGLDCSKYQEDINWSQVKAAGVEFAFIKITEGTTGHEDNIYNLKARIQDAQKNGVKVGYYHFARPGNVDNPEDDANEEVKNVVAHIGFLPKADLPIVLDIEAYSNSIIWDNKIDHMNKFITAFIYGLNAEGLDVIIYSYKSFIEENSAPTLGIYPLWLAAYLNSPETSTPGVPSGWTEWKIWQFTEKGQVSGYNDVIDLNIMKKEYFELFK
jgi:lysozyme